MYPRSSVYLSSFALTSGRRGFLCARGQSFRPLSLLLEAHGSFPLLQTLLDPLSWIRGLCVFPWADCLGSGMLAPGPPEWPSSLLTHPHPLSVL